MTTTTMFPHTTSAMLQHPELMHSMLTTLQDGIAMYHYSKVRQPKLRWVVLDKELQHLRWYDIQDGDRDPATLKIITTSHIFHVNGMHLSDISAVTVGQPQVDELVYDFTHRDVDMDNFVSVTTYWGVLEVECLRAEDVQLLSTVLSALQQMPLPATSADTASTPAAWHHLLAEHAARQQHDVELNAKAELLYQRLFGESLSQHLLLELQHVYEALQRKLVRLQQDQRNISNVAHKQEMALYDEHKELAEINLALRMRASKL